MKRKLPVAILGGLALLLPTGMADAKKPKKDHEQAYSALRRGEILPVTRIMAIAEQRTAGQIIKIGLKTKSRRSVYVRKVVSPNGLVQKMFLDARTGMLVSIGGD